MSDILPASSPGEELAALQSALGLEARKYRDLFESMDEGYCIIQMIRDQTGQAVDWRFLEVNPAFEKHNGMRGAEGRTMVEMVPDIEPKWMRIYDRVAVTGESLRFEESSVPLDRVFDLYAFRVGMPGEGKVAVLFTDITERRRTEAALRGSEERLRVTLESAEMGAWDWDLASGMILWNERHFYLLGLAPDGLPKDTAFFFQFVHPEDAPRVSATLADAVEKNSVFQCEFRIIRRNDGVVRWMSGYGRVMESSGGKPTRMTGVMYDCTGRKTTEKRLRLAHDNLEQRVAERTRELTNTLQLLRQETESRRELEIGRRDLLRRLVVSQEEERKRISRELHDNLSQHMVAVKFGLARLRERVEVPGGPAAAQEFDDLGELVDLLIDAAHRQAWELRPSELDHLGLEAALQSYVQDWSRRTGIRAEFHGSDADRLPPHVEIAFYRIVQEALTNAARHSSCARVRIDLKVGAGTELSIMDDGVGMTPWPDGGRTGRLGMLGMRERMALIGGTLEIDSQPGKGTRVLARLEDMREPSLE